MTVYTKSQWQKEPDAILDAARRQGEVRIRTDDGREFSLRQVPNGETSPLDVPGVNLNLTADEIVAAVRASRER